MKTFSVLAVACSVVLFGRPAASAEMAPSWTLVPEGTVLVARVPDAAGFMAALHEQTKLGAVVLTKDRLRRAFELWQEENKEEWEALAKGLGEHDLKLEDLPRIFAGEAGFALVLEARGERSPLMVGLTWLEPGEELAERLVKALQSVVEERAGEPGAPVRVDLDLAGHEVMQLTETVFGTENIDTSDLFEDGKIDPENLEDLQKKLAEKYKNQKLIPTDRRRLFVARLGGRLLIANTFSQSSAEVLAKDEDERSKIDWDELTGVEQATAVFARFLSAHDSRGDGYAAQLVNAPGVAASLPEGVTLLEAFGNLRPLVAMAGQARDGKTARILGALGLDSLGPVALRMALDGNALRSGMFLAAEEPRSGLLGLLDQKPLNPEPPEWVPSSVLEYQQFSFDLGEAYARLKELAVSQEGENARQSFSQIEGIVQGTLQTDLTTLLSSLGQRHIGITFPPKNEPQPAGEKAEAHVALLGGSQRVGLAWQVKDEQVWNRVLQVIGQFAPAAGESVQAAEEQGFKGFRFRQPPLEAGLFLGRGYLVLGVGSEVAESMLSVLRTPPTGDASLLASGLIERGHALLPAEPSLFYQIGDAGVSAKTSKQAIEGIIDMPFKQPQLHGAAAPEDHGDLERQKALAAKLKELLPGDSELEGVLGVSVDQAVVTSHGLVFRSALELPAP